MASEPFAVGYNRKGLRSVVFACLFGVLLGFVLTWIGYAGPSSNDGFGSRAIVFVSKFFGPLTIGLCVVLAIQTALRKGPALIVASDGLTVGFLPGPSLSLPWSDVAGVYRLVQTVQGNTVESLVVQVWDEPALLGRLGRGARLTTRLAAITGQPSISLGLRLLDRPWSEIEAALAPFVATHLPALVKVRPATLAWPKTLEDFQERFRQAPLGVWTTAVGGSSPGDTTVWFCTDGTGGVSSGAAGFLGGGEGLEWRTRGDWAVEIRLEGEASWMAYAYGFREEAGKVKIFFDESDPEAWIEGLGADDFSYDGPCRSDR